MSKSVFVCLRCQRPVHFWGEVSTGYWKHSNGGYPAPPTCGQKPVAVRRAELSYSPALRNALRTLRVKIRDGMQAGQALTEVAKETGFMAFELKRAYEGADNAGAKN